MLPLVLWTTSHGIMMAVGVVRGRGSVLVAPFVHVFFCFCFCFCSILVCGDISGVHRSIGPGLVSTSTDRYGNA